MHLQKAVVLSVAMPYEDETLFWKQWPTCVEALRTLYEGALIFPDYELVHDSIQRLRCQASTNDIEKILRQLWNFDERFFGEPLPFREQDYAWAVYSLVYLGQDESVIEKLLSIYPPLLGG